MLKAYKKFEEVVREFEKVFGRRYDMVEEYKLEDAEIVLISMGSLVGTMKDAVDELRRNGEKVGILKIISYRPFPAEKIYEAIKNANAVLVLEKDVSIGMEGGLISDIKSSMYSREDRPPIFGFSVGLGGRDVTIRDIKGLVSKVKRREAEEFEFLNLRRDVL
jgi:pyruvate ferredoxin oxidoreductase alpha subunit